MSARKASSAIVGLILVILIIAGDIITGAVSSHAPTANCNNPPIANPNTCHIYLWNHFPSDLGTTPKTGLFGNDTSYYFQYNITGIIGFSICTQVALGPNGEDGNATLTLQYSTDAGVTWNNVASVGGGTAGSVNVMASSFTFVQTCSLTVGDFANPIANCSTVILTCEFRIAGNTPITGPTGCAPSSCQLKFAMMSVQFYYSTSFTTQTNTVTCDASSRSLTVFTNQCTIQIPRTVATTITVVWAATNETGAGCGVGDNCWRRNLSPGLTCTIAIAANICQNINTAFSPAFTTNTPIVIENWTPTTAGTFNIKPSSSQFNILT